MFLKSLLLLFLSFSLYSESLLESIGVFSPFPFTDFSVKKKGKCQMGGDCVCLDCKVCPECVPTKCPEPECPEMECPELECPECPVCPACKKISCRVRKKPVPETKLIHFKRVKLPTKYFYKDDLMGQLYCIYRKDRKGVWDYVRKLEEVINRYEKQIMEINKFRKSRYCEAVTVNKNTGAGELEDGDTGVYTPDGR